MAKYATREQYRETVEFYYDRHGRPCWRVVEEVVVEQIPMDDPQPALPSPQRAGSESLLDKAGRFIGNVVDGIIS